MPRIESKIEAKHIYYIRKKLILTQRELAKELGVSYDTVNSWEQGRRNVGVASEIKIREFCKKKGIKI